MSTTATAKEIAATTRGAFLDAKVEILAWVDSVLVQLAREGYRGGFAVELWVETRPCDAASNATSLHFCARVITGDEAAPQPSYPPGPQRERYEGVIDDTMAASILAFYRGLVK